MMMCIFISFLVYVTILSVADVRVRMSFYHPLWQEVVRIKLQWVGKIFG